MGLVHIYDPYEWVDPEKGRRGVLVHTSQLGDMTFTRAVVQETWHDVWARGFPPFVVLGEWEDPEADDLARGPRAHPYGLEAYQLNINGRILVFPNKEAADAYNP